MSGWRASLAVLTGAVLSMAPSACGSGPRQDVNEQGGHFSIEVPTATFPTSQSLSQHTHMVITVHNTDTRTIPDVAVTITDSNLGTTAQAFAERIDRPSAQTNLASASRPVWIVDQGPGLRGCRYSCQSGGAGGAVTANSNTWTLGPLAPGHSATFEWAVTAIKAGTHLVHYRVAAGLNGKAIAQLAGGQPPEGTFTVTIHRTPKQEYVNDRGQIVRTRSP